MACMHNKNIDVQRKHAKKAVRFKNIVSSKMIL